MCRELEHLKNDQHLSQINADDLRDVLLEYLEKKVGARDKSWEIIETIYLGVVPMTYYPYGYDRKIINVRLTPGTQQYYQQKLFQMSHEVVHLLDPAGSGRANNLEEGFATWFSVYVCEICVPSYQAKQHVLRDSCRYKKPFELVGKMPDPFEVIKNIRGNGYTMTENVSKDVLDKHTGRIYNGEELNFLLQTFEQNS